MQTYLMLDQVSLCTLVRQDQSYFRLGLCQIRLVQVSQEQAQVSLGQVGLGYVSQDQAQVRLSKVRTVLDQAIIGQLGLG